MGLGIYSKADVNTLVDTDTPLTFTFDGSIGGVMERVIYVRNDDTKYFYTNISVEAVDTSGDDITDESVAGFSWKFIEKDVLPSPEEWTLVTPGNTLTLSNDLGNALESDTITFLPVYLQVIIPRDRLITTIKDVVLRISATENLR